MHYSGTHDEECGWSVVGGRDRSLLYEWLPISFVILPLCLNPHERVGTVAGRYFSNGLVDINMLFRAMMRHSDVSATGSQFREIVSEQELTSILL